MKDKKIVLLLLMSIAAFLVLLIAVLGIIGVLDVKNYFAFLEPENPVKLVDIDYPTQVDKISLQKREEKLMEKEEDLAKKENDLNELASLLETKESQIEELKKNIQEERERLNMVTKDWDDRKKKINDIARKVTSMPPAKAIEMMENWRDLDIIDVLRQIDKNALDDGLQSLTPYLLTLFNAERRAEITRKMLLPPVEQN